MSRARRRPRRHRAARRRPPPEHEPAGPDPLALHDAQRDAHDRRRERGDDHRADDRRRGVGDDAGGRDEPESTSIVQNADCLARASPERRSRSSDSSSRVRRWFSGRTRSRRPMSMARVCRCAAAGGDPGRPGGPGEPPTGPAAAAPVTSTQEVVMGRRAPSSHRQPCSSGTSRGARPRVLHLAPRPTPHPPRRRRATAPATPEAPRPAGRRPRHQPTRARRHPCPPGSRSTRQLADLPPPRGRPRQHRRRAGGAAPGFDRVVWQFAGAGARPTACTTSTAHLGGQRRRRRRGRRRLPRGRRHDGRRPRRRPRGRPERLPRLAGGHGRRGGERDLRRVRGLRTVVRGVRGRERPFGVSVLGNPTRLVVDSTGLSSGASAQVDLPVPRRVRWSVTQPIAA